MPTSNSDFGEHTTGANVVQAFAPQVKDKTILITGANPGGIGYATATALAEASPKLLILAGRNADKLAETAAGVEKVNPDVTCKSIILDLGSQQAVRKAAKEVMADSDITQIDILINNAGIMNLPNRELSPEGIEKQFATNHVGHFLFTNLILPKLKISASKSSRGSTRVVNVSSRAVLYGGVRFADYNFTKLEKDLPSDEHLSQLCRDQWNEHEDKPYIAQAAYGQSKTANVLFSLGANQRLFEDTGILSTAIHPGVVGTQLGRNMDPEVLQSTIERFSKAMPGFQMKNIESGCSTTLVAALDPKVGENDLLFADCQVADWTPAYASDPKKADQLWKLSEELVGETFAA